MKVFIRRCISCSLFSLISVILLVLLFPALIILLLIDSFKKTSFAAGFICIVSYFYFELIGIILAFLIFALKPIFFRSPKDYIRANFKLQNFWASSLMSIFERAFRLEFSCQGLENVEKGNFILLLRHSSLIDTLIPANFIAKPNQIILRYVLKSELLWDPCIDIVGNRMLNCFIDRKKGNKELSKEQIASLMDNISDDSGTLIYPEGTRFSNAKREKLLNKLKNKDPELYTKAKELENLLPPKLTGIRALLKENRSSDIVFCCHYGLEKIRRLGDLFNGSFRKQKIYVWFWRTSFEEIPNEEKAIEKYIFDHWKTMNELIEQIKT